MLVSLVQLSFAQNITSRGRVGNSIYVYEDQDGGESSTITRFYQTVRFNGGLKSMAHVKLNIAGRVLSQFGGSDLSDELRYNAYRVSISANHLLNNKLDFELGRQFLHPGLILGGLDGLNMVYRPSRKMGIQLYGGVESHLLKAVKIYNADDALVYGGTFRYNNFFHTNAQLVYLQKQSSNEAIWQIVGLNLANYSVQNLSLILQAHYDLVNSRMHRLYASSTYRLSKLSANIYYKQQHPQIYGNSYFQIFKVSDYQLLGLNLAYQLSKRFALNGSMQGVQLEEGFGNRYMLSLEDPNGSIGVIYETGDLGEQLGLMLDYGYEILPDLIASFSVDYSRYRFEEIYEYDRQLANALRLDYRFLDNWRFDLEYQWLNNRIMKSDQRILNHIQFIW